MSEAGSPRDPVGTSQPPAAGSPVARPELPAAMSLLSVVKKAFEASKDAPRSAARVLNSSTSCKGFQGKHQTKRWCCRLTAVLETLAARQMFPKDALQPVDTEFGTFVLLATEMAWWERLRATGTHAGARAHLSHFATDVAIRVGVLVARSGKAETPRLLEDAAWGNPRNRGALIDSLRCSAGFRSYKDLCETTGFEQDTLTRWVRKGTRPTPDSIDKLSGHLARRIPGTNKATIHRLLSWHYGLSTIMAEVERGCGNEFSSELYRVFVATTIQVASNARRSLASGELSDRHAFAAIFHSLRTAPDVGPPLELLRNAGAGADFVADVEAAHAAWQPIVHVGPSKRATPDWTVLASDLPKLRNGERRRRRRCPPTRGSNS